MAAHHKRLFLKNVQKSYISTMSFFLSTASTDFHSGHFSFIWTNDRVTDCPPNHPTDKVRCKE